MKEKKIFNTSSRERHNEAKIINGNPDGIMSFNETNHHTFTLIYKKMLARTWFAEQVNISKDKVNYPKLSAEEKNMYDLVLAQLIANDSIQTNQLMDKINSYITSPIVNACLSRQAYEESLHAFSYSIMAEDICNDTERIYYMHLEDEELNIKNQAVENMYSVLYEEGREVSNTDILMCCVGNQILEELVFPGGFAAMLSLGDKLPGSTEMISEILKDETLSHVLLFRTIYRTIIKEEFNGIVPDIVKEKASKLIQDMCNAEIRWTKYVTKGIMGFSDKAIENFIKSKANNVCGNMMLDKLYDLDKVNPLADLIAKYLSGGELDTRQNFFLENVTNYNKGGMTDDWD